MELLATGPGQKAQWLAEQGGIANLLLRQFNANLQTLDNSA